MSNKIWLALVVGLLTTGASRAGSQLESTVSNCTAFNCAGMTIRGRIPGDEPFVVQIYAVAGECLRLDVSEQTHDLAMLLIGPTVIHIGAMADDRDPPNDRRPLLVYNLLEETGWYTVVVSLRDPANVNARFKLEYGRYGGGNPNCVSA